MFACPRGGVILSVSCQSSDEFPGFVAESTIGFYNERDELSVLSFAFFLVEALFDLGLSFRCGECDCAAVIEVGRCGGVNDSDVKIEKVGAKGYA